MPLPLKLLRVPPLTTTSAKVKSVLASDRVKVMSAVWPCRTLVLSLLMAMVGGVVSKVLVANVRVLLASAPSTL